MKIRTESSVKDIVFNCVLDESGYFDFSTVPLFGYLKLIKFKIGDENIAFSPYRVIMDLDDFEIFNEDVESDGLVVLKFQSRDGFGQYWSTSSEYYLLNGEVLNCMIKGTAGNKLSILYRLEEV